ncbi:MAG TPA: NTP transferase domain-containing protein [Candidatus Limnocylindrales bacterium]|jgi:CTP:molybdopterin cytidylyltransferase MocA|nr:NTP transferase domain-containing protein [Candidatus Limnocylindrales bacterium]
MTVAAVMLFETPEGALADTAGRAAARRMVEAAWAGGATPIVVLSRDPGGEITQVLAGSPALLAEPAPPDAGAVGRIVGGIRLAAAQVSETDAVLVWPGQMAWVDAETVTSLIERHGVEREAVLRPQYEGTAGWPALVPMEQLDVLAHLPTELRLDELFERLAALLPTSLFDTGDPGTVHDRSVAHDDLPPYSGPPEPARQAPEWGAAAAEAPDESPLEGPALAPYGQAADPESD